jgi:hypothetical protein
MPSHGVLELGKPRAVELRLGRLGSAPLLPLAIDAVSQSPVRLAVCQQVVVVVVCGQLVINHQLSEINVGVAVNGLMPKSNSPCLSAIQVQPSGCEALFGLRPGPERYVRLDRPDGRNTGWHEGWAH